MRFLFNTALIAFLSVALTACNSADVCNQAPENLDEHTAPFAAVIAFYGNLEMNGFVDLSQEYVLSRGQLHPIVWRYNMGMEPNYWRVVFSFHDITGNGQMDLIIGSTGADHCTYSTYYITGIYTLIDDRPVSVIQYDGSRALLLLSTDTCGNVILEHLWGHGGSSEQFFYGINESGELALLDKIISHDFDRDLHYAGEIFRPRIRHIGDTTVNLSETEYITLMHIYGSIGYELLHIISEEEIIAYFRIYHPCKYEHFQGFGNSRSINLEWDFILTPDDCAG